LTTFLASIVNPRGHVYTFDVEPNLWKLPKKYQKSWMSKYVTMHEMNLKKSKKML